MGSSLSFVLPELQNMTDTYDETIWLLEAEYNWIVPLFLHFRHQSSTLSVCHSLTFSISLGLSHSR